MTTIKIADGIAISDHDATANRDEIEVRQAPSSHVDR